MAGEEKVGIADFDTKWSWDKMMMSFQCFRKHIRGMLQTAIIQRIMFTASRNVLLYCSFMALPELSVTSKNPLSVF